MPNWKEKEKKLLIQKLKFIQTKIYVSSSIIIDSPFQLEA